MSFITKDATVFDIGAHVGTVCHQLHMAGAGKIVACEPCYQSFNVLRQIDYVTAIHAACWNYQTIVEVSYSENESGWSSVVPEKWIEAYPNAQYARPQYVAAVTLDHLIEKFEMPQFIKIDTEGTELQVLFGLTQKPEFLSFEFHRKFQQDTLACLGRLKDLGFKRAHYTVENLDINTVPTTKIDEFITKFQLEAPAWGNIIVR